jgi:hypothetical protein
MKMKSIGGSLPAAVMHDQRAAKCHQMTWILRWHAVHDPQRPDDVYKQDGWLLFSKRPVDNPFWQECHRPELILSQLYRTPSR